MGGSFIFLGSKVKCYKSNYLHRDNASFSFASYAPPHARALLRYILVFILQSFTDLFKLFIIRNIVVKDFLSPFLSLWIYCPIKSFTCNLLSLSHLTAVVKGVKDKNTNYRWNACAREAVPSLRKAAAVAPHLFFYVFGRKSSSFSAILSAVAEERPTFAVWHAPCKERGNNASDEADKAFE